MNNVKTLCFQRGIEQKELALAVGVSQPTVSNWFNNKKNPSGKRLDKLSEILGVSRAEILGYGADPSEPYTSNQPKPQEPNSQITPLRHSVHGSEIDTIRVRMFTKLLEMDEEQITKAEYYADFLISQKEEGNA